jgi:hypothetical protein
MYKDSYNNPTDRRELLIIGFILNLYILKYYWKINIIENNTIKL